MLAIRWYTFDRIYPNLTPFMDIHNYESKRLAHEESNTIIA